MTDVEKVRPCFLAQNVNHWFQASPQDRMVRAVGSTARAFVSKSYRPLDNWDLLKAVLPKLQSLDVQVASCEITEKRLYIQAVAPKIQGVIKVGDVVQGGIFVSNSEVGKGSLTIQPFVFRLRCKNGLIVRELGYHRRHVGKRGEGEDDSINEFLRNDTRQAEDRAFFLKVRDLVDHTLSPDGFRTMMESMKKAAGEKIEGKLEKVVEVASKKLELEEGEKNGFLRHLIEGKDLSRWGAVNAVTSLAHDAANYDRSVKLEKAGGRLLELPPNEWRAIAEAN